MRIELLEADKNGVLGTAFRSVRKLHRVKIIIHERLQGLEYQTLAYFHDYTSEVVHTRDVSLFCDWNNTRLLPNGRKCMILKREVIKYCI